MEKLDTLQSLLSTLRRAGDRECLIALEKEDVTRWSCVEVAEKAEQLARGLVELGIQPGEIVPILAHNRPEWVIAALALIGAGATVSPLDTQINREVLEQVLQDSQARFIFTTTEYLNRLGQIERNVQLRPILFDVEPDDERGWQVLLSEQETSLPAVGLDDPAALFYTSGTTGVPKGVPLTHRNLVFQLNSVYETHLLKGSDRVMLPLPMYHVYPFTVGTLTPLAFQLPLILPQSLTGPQVLRALREGAVTIVVGIPRVYRAMYDGIETQITDRGKIVSTLFHAALQASIGLRRRFGWQVGKRLFRPLRAAVGPQLRLLTSGGSALAPELAWKLEGLGWDVGIGYGLTESSPMLTINLPTPNVPKLDSVGLPLPGIELRIDPVVPSEERLTYQSNGRESKEGEILARGTSVFSGYRNRPEANAEAFSGDGWFRTGDLGYRDEAGYLYISGRASTMIVLEGGKNIQPEPLEDIYQQNELIREIGILYEDNRLVAVIVPEIEAVNRLFNGETELAIREAVNERLKVVASYQRIGDYAIAAEPITRTNLGKIRRHILKEQYRRIKEGLVENKGRAVGPLPIEDMSEKDQSLFAQPETRQVWGWLAERYADKRLTPDTSPQLDLGIDSLEWLTLTLQVRDLTGIELDDEAIRQIGTVRDLLQAVQNAAENESSGIPLSIDNVDEILTDEQKKWLAPLPPLLAGLATVSIFLFQVLMRFFFRIKVYGLENLPFEGNFVLTPNHTSMLDGLVVAAALPYTQTRQTAWIAAREIMLANPITRLATRLGQVLPIDRFSGGTGIREIALALAALRQGKNLVLFPEGRVALSDKMLPFREGIGIILDKYPIRVVPVYIQGTREAMPVDASLPKLKPVTITFGQPCESRELDQTGAGESAAARIASVLHDRVAALAEAPQNVQHREQGVAGFSQRLSPVFIIGVITTLIAGLLWFLKRQNKD